MMLCDTCTFGFTLHPYSGTSDLKFHCYYRNVLTPGLGHCSLYRERPEVVRWQHATHLPPRILSFIVYDHTSANTIPVPKRKLMLIGD